MQVVFLKTWGKIVCAMRNWYVWQQRSKALCVSMRNAQSSSLSQPLHISSLKRLALSTHSLAVLFSPVNVSSWPANFPDLLWQSEIFNASSGFLEWTQLLPDFETQLYVLKIFKFCCITKIIAMLCIKITFTFSSILSLE